MKTCATLLSLSVALLLAVGLTACGKAKEEVQNAAAEKLVEKAIKAGNKDADVDVNLKNGSMTIKNKDGNNLTVKTDGDKVKMVGTDNGKNVEYVAEKDSFTMKDGNVTMTSGKGAKIPEGFPKDVPVYAGAEITLASASAADGTFMVQATSADPLAKVAEKMKKDLINNGWKEESSTDQAGAFIMLNYTKDQRAAMITLAQQDAKTMLSVTVSKN